MNLPAPHSPAAGQLERRHGLARWLTDAERAELSKPAAARLALERAVGDTPATPYVTAWLQTIDADNTRRSYALDAVAFLDWLRDRFAVPDAAPVSLAAVTELHIAEYAEHMREVSSRRGRPLSAPSRARRLSALASLFRYLRSPAVAQVTANPVAEVSRPKVSREGVTPALALGDVDRLVRAAAESRYDADRDLAVLLLLAANALRVSEVTGLDVTDLGYEQGRHTARVRIKGGKSVVVPLDPAVATAVAAHAGERTAGPLLLNNDGGRLTRWQVAAILARLSRVAGLPAVRPHMLRATFITELLESGQPLHQVQHMVRHASGDTTQKYWRRRQGLEQDAALSALLVSRLPSLTRAAQPPAGDEEA